MISISNADFDNAVRAALDSIPDEFRPYLENVVVEVHDRPDEKVLEDDELPEDLLGIYLGVPLDMRGVDGDPTPLPDRVLIFRENLCAVCDSRAELVDEIRITILHEIGHHFGLDEDRLEELGYG
ncbi:MAG: metallopeptidase family protein [Planctomycetota bacterium]|nr:MAG: metallopeptidase family protein [Planctomycetota bacterium]